MAILTLNRILKYLSVAIVVAIILIVLQGQSNYQDYKMDKSYIAMVAFGAAVFAFLLDLIFSYFKRESFSPYDPYNIYNVADTEVEASILMDPMRYQYITREESGDNYESVTGIPGYYLINNGEFSDGTLSFDNSSELLRDSRMANFEQIEFNSALDSQFMPNLGKDRGVIQPEPVQMLRMNN